MKRHLEAQHTLNKPEFPCIQCGKKYNRKDNLEQHIKRYHRDANTKQNAAIPANWELVEQEISHDAQSSSDISLGSHYMPESDDSWSNTAYESAPSNAPIDNSTVNPRKRGAAVSIDTLEIGPYDVQAKSYEKEKVDEMTPWWCAHALTVKKMPLLDQIELKLAINNIIGQKEMEILRRTC